MKLYTVERARGWQALWLLTAAACASEAGDAMEPVAAPSGAEKAPSRAPAASQQAATVPTMPTMPTMPTEAKPSMSTATPAAGTPAEKPASMEAAKPAMAMSGIAKDVPEKFLADAGAGWSTLITGRWELPAGTEGYYCARMTLDKSVTASAFRAVAPVGTHHTLLTLADDNSQPDGVSKCSSGSNGARNILGTGVGESELKLPEGVGMTLKAGQQLLLNLHLFNVTDKTLTGLSGTLVKMVDPASVKFSAEEAMAGTVSLNIPAGGPTTQKGECTITHDSTIFAVGPHMHQLGVHLKAVAHSSMLGEVLLYDGAYDFDNPELRYLPKEVPMKAGDKVQVECTYQNDTGKTVMFGDSSKAEMCFAGLFRYPEGQKSYICAR